MDNFTTALFDDLVQFGLHFLYAIIILIVGFQLVTWLSRRIRKMKLLKRIDPNVASFITTSSKLVLRVVVMVIAALVLGIPGSAFVTLFGSAGVAIGLALQGSLSNLAGGLMLLFFHPFSVGDYIMAGSNEGFVHQISAFYTTILTVDNKRVILPNGELTNTTLVNYSAEPTRQLVMPFSVARDSSPEHVRRVLLETAAANPMVFSEPAPVAPMTAHSENAMVFTLRCWVSREDCKPAEFALLEAVKLAFDRENIRIPYPQMDIHMKP